MARSDVIDLQIAEVRQVFSEARYAAVGDGTFVVTVLMSLPSGWNLPTCEVDFVVPIPYPAAQPDCFYAPPSLRLASGAQPVNSGSQPLLGRDRLWFSWHLQQPWNPARHSLLTYVRFIHERLRNAN